MPWSYIKLHNVKFKYSTNNYFFCILNDKQNCFDLIIYKKKIKKEKYDLYTTNINKSSCYYKKKVIIYYDFFR